MNDDRDQILQIIADYGWALDTQDWTTYQHCLTPDAQRRAGDGEPMVGREDIVSYISKIRATLTATQHIMTNFAVSIDGDSASVRCMTLSHIVTDRTVSSGGYNRFELVRTDEGWRISSLYSNGIWESTDAEVTRG